MKLFNNWNAFQKFLTISQIMVVSWVIKFSKQTFVQQIRIILSICFHSIFVNATNSLTSPLFNLLILVTNVSLGNRAILAIVWRILCCVFFYTELLPCSQTFGHTHAYIRSHFSVNQYMQCNRRNKQVRTLFNEAFETQNHIQFQIFS